MPGYGDWVYCKVIGEQITEPPGFLIMLRDFDLDFQVLNEEGEIIGYAFPHIHLVEIIIQGITWEKYKLQWQLARQTAIHPIPFHNCMIYEDEDEYEDEDADAEDEY